MSKTSMLLPDFGSFVGYLTEKGWVGYKFAPEKLYNELKSYGCRKPDGTMARGWRSCVAAWWKLHEPIVRKHEREERRKAREKAKRDQRKKERKERAYQRHMSWEEKHRDYYRAFTDGSCEQYGTSYGIGGSAYVILQNGKIIHEASVGKACTTNNKMEMLAIISVLHWLPDHSKVVIYSDSQYAIMIFQGYWRPKKNLHLVEMFEREAKRHDAVEFSWVKGHNGNKWNEYVDNLATSATRRMVEKIENECINMQADEV